MDDLAARDVRCTLRLDLDHAPTAPLYLNREELYVPLTGRLDATVEAMGSLAAPAQGSAVARITQLAGTFNDQPFQVAAPAVVRYPNERLFIDQLRVTAQDSVVAVAGEIPLRETQAGGAVPPGAITVDARANLASLAQYAPPRLGLSASGQLQLDGAIRGTLQAIDPALTLIMAAGAVATPATQPGLTNIDLQVLGLDDLWYRHGSLLAHVGPGHNVTVVAIVAMNGLFLIGLTYRVMTKRFVVAWDTGAMATVYAIAVGLAYALSSH